MPYQTSQASRDIMAQLRNLLGGNSGGGGNNVLAQIFGPTSQDLTANGLIPPAPKPSSSNFLADILGQGPISGDLSNLGGDQQSARQPQDPNAEFEAYRQQLLASLAQEAFGKQSASGLNQADYEQALKDSAAKIKGAFGAEIGAVKASSASARHQTKRSKKQIKAMYNALARQYNKGAGVEVAQGKDIANAINNVAGQAASGTQASSDQLLNEQAALAQGLGVQAALPTVAAQQSADTAKQVGNIRNYGSQEAVNQLANSGSQQRFLVRGGKNSLLEGTNRRADLVEQLQAFLQQNMGKIADIKGQRGQALAANDLAFTKQANDSAANSQDTAWKHKGDVINWLNTIAGQTNSSNSQLADQQQAQNGQLLDWMKLLSGAAGQTGDPKKMEEILKLIQGAIAAQGQ
jgi:hypothetical protein